MSRQAERVVSVFNVKTALYQYRGTKAEIERLKARMTEIAELREETCEQLKAVVASMTPMSQTNTVGDPTFEAVDKLVRLYGQEERRIAREIERLTKEIAVVDSAISRAGLNEIEHKLIRYKYLDSPARNMTWISTNIAYSRSNCYRIHNEAVEKIKSGQKWT
jgi:prefoldin subunit 5